MSKDHLDNELGLEVKVPSSDSILADLGVSAKVKSRFISSLDRLAGSVPDMLTAYCEGVARKKRAKTDIEVDAIKASGAAFTSGIQLDDPYMQAVLGDAFDKALKKHANKRLVLFEAAKQLESTPPTDEEANNGPDQLSESFLNRFESYVENATEEELKAKWAKILAAEIKNPNLFSPKVLRMVDELEPEVAILFERICHSRVDDVIIKVLMDELSFDEKNNLVASGLIVEPSFGQVCHFQTIENINHGKFWLLNFDENQISLEGVFDLPKSKGSNNVVPLTKAYKEPYELAVPVYVLTKAGEKIASILPNNPSEVLHRYGQALATFIPTAIVRTGKLDGKKFVGSAVWENGICKYSL